MIVLEQVGHLPRSDPRPRQQLFQHSPSRHPHTLREHLSPLRPRHLGVEPDPGRVRSRVHHGVAEQREPVYHDTA
ncbi:hypothetical protein B484DRAFT_454055 [Ochromonadaceae sp. CCMP2298]|nr:hypothetical protein B484DRAFT_454784 [Ochromonadaceae sp. CCMP2298]KAJ1417247.1 hypothetical protein B484DRAFT_454055 [Ochromonadaceae sp. CCMP2298]